jgi:hypothetical protein
MISEGKPRMKKGAIFKLGKRAIVFLILAALLIPLNRGGAETVYAQDKQPKISIGVLENVVLLPWRIKMPARIDTGAATSSLDARELKIKENQAEFKLPPKYGGMKITLPIVGWKVVRSAESKEQRPVVEMDLCIGSRQLRTQINLNDRSRVRYPLIIGRNVLIENLTVDCDRTYCAPPSCPAEDSQK